MSQKSSTYVTAAAGNVYTSKKATRRRFIIAQHCTSIELSGRKKKRTRIVNRGFKQMHSHVA